MGEVASEISETWAVVSDRPGTEQAHVFLTFRAFHHDEDGGWIGECVDLGVASGADEAFEALANVLEATMLYLHTLEETGQRPRVFAERGVKLHYGLPLEGEPDHRQVDLRPNEYVVDRLVAHRGELAA